MQHQPVTTKERRSRAQIDRAQVAAERPSRAQIEPAALALLSRHSAGLLATARRYSATPEDAEDAYQRGVEILLTKAPTTTEADLLPWLKTVVKHEAYAVRKSSARALPADHDVDGELGFGDWTDERAERYERLRVGAEAMAALKPQEIRCLLLKAEGLSYREICDATGFTYTKVNRCLTEGRRRFLMRVAGIESGAECERLAPVISRMADGEASTEDMRLARPHLKGCLACKATLREYRATPARLAGLVPPVVALAGGGSGAGFFGRLLVRLGGMSDAAGAKVAAVAAAGAVLAGAGGAAGIGALDHDPAVVAPSAFETQTTSSVAQAAPPTTPALSAPDPSAAAIQALQATRGSTPTTTTAAPANEAKPATATGPEFDPGTGGGSEAGSSTQTHEFASAPTGSRPAPSSSTPSAPATPSSSTRPAPSHPATSSRPAEFGP